MPLEMQKLINIFAGIEGVVTAKYGEQESPWAGKAALDVLALKRRGKINVGSTTDPAASWREQVRPLLVLSIVPR